MKYFLYFAVVFNIAGFAVFAQTPPPPPAPLIYTAPGKNELKEFIADDKTFSITFPGTPKVSTETAENAKVTIYRVYRSGSNSIVNTADFNFELENNKEKIYETIKNTYLKIPKSSLVAENDFEFDGKKGKEFEILQDYTFLIIRVLIAGTRIYELRSDVTNWHIISKYNKDKVAEFKNETRRFFASFIHNTSLKSAEMPAPMDFLGEVNETSYKNTFFGFTLEFPNSWHRSDESEIEAKKRQGLDLLKTDREKVNRAFEDSSKKEVIILAIGDQGIGSTRGTNLGVGVLKQPNSQATANQVAAATKNFFLTNPKITQTEDVKNVTINGTEFSTFVIRTEINGVSINQKILITMRKGYSITFVYSYLNSEGLQSLDKIMQTLNFEKK